jgi:cobalt-zinc-cadmium efflux system outer membrane protein
LTQHEQVLPCREVIPAGVVLEDGLSEDEAVQTALSNNSAFQATLAQLGMAHGDALQASLLANPNYLIYFPTNSKEGQYTLFAPIESYLLRPTRVKVANREYRRVGEQLVQNGLDLARDVRVAYADLAVASEQATLAQEALLIRESIADLTQKRLQDGDISELETIAAKVDRLNAKAATGVQKNAVAIAEARLASLIGLTHLEMRLMPLPIESPNVPILDESMLISQALACRPDYASAKWAVAAASQRSRLSRWLFLRLDSVVDVRSDPGRSGGGMRFDIPIFNRNQGGIIRADWEVNAAMHARDAIHDQIVADVRTAVRQMQQTSENLHILQLDVAPALAEALQIAQRGFADGGTDYLLVLQTTTQYLDTRARILDQKAAYARALAELERAVGCHLEAGGVDVERLAEAIDVDSDNDGDGEERSGD